MTASWAKNEVTAAKRRVALIVKKDDDTMAPRGTDFSALGYVLISGTSAPDFKYALGVMVNQRIPLIFNAFNFTGNSGTDELTAVGHGMETGDGPVVTGAGGGTLPGGLFVSTPYWIIRIDNDKVQLAESLADAYAGDQIDLTTNGSGAFLEIGSYIPVSSSLTQRGVDGHFDYLATQAETNHDGKETLIMVHSVDSDDYDRDVGAGGLVSVAMTGSSDDFGSVELENGLTRDDATRIILRSLAAEFSKVGNDYVFRDMADSKDSHHGTVTSAGRIDAGVDDPT